MTLTERLSIDLIVQLRPLVATVRARRAPLADQLERAATSVALNIGEAGGGTGGRRLHALRIAAGEAHEVKLALAVVAAWGYVDAAKLAPALRLSDRLGAVLHGLIVKLA